MKEQNRNASKLKMMNKIQRNCLKMRALGVASLTTLAAALPVFAESAPVAGAAGTTLEQNFVNPPESAKPQVMWMWMDGNVSNEGVTADLEAMKEVGLGGVLQFDLSGSGAPNPRGPVKLFSNEYWSAIRRAFAVCERLGLEFNKFNCPGFSASGGPWVTPEEAMQFVAYTTLTVAGGTELATQLAEPTVEVRGSYRDIAVLAFPTPPGEARTLWLGAPTITVTGAKGDPATLNDGDFKKGIELAAGAKGKAGGTVQFAFEQPRSFRSARLHGDGRGVVVVEASDDGQDFRPLQSIDLSALAKYPIEIAHTLSFAPTTARYFRVRVTQGRYKLTGFDLSDGAAIQDIVGKAAWTHQYEMTHNSQGDGAEAVVNPASIVDLTERVSADGKLEWSVPQGTWTILRIGHGAKKKTNHPAEEAGRGLECDKLSKGAVERHFHAAVQPYIEAAGEKLGEVLTAIHFDSYEAGSLNWTPGFAEEFRKRRGYAMEPYFPVLTGRIVGNAEVSERFLWDYRRTIGDLLYENYYQNIHRLAREAGLLFSSEAYGNVWGGPFDDLRCATHADILLNEFWGATPGSMERVSGMADAAHVHGIKIVGAEAFTGAGNWDMDPYALKAKGDRMFARGVNRYYFHASPHQPWDDPKGGIFFVPLILHRGNTWFAHSGDYMKYLARCQYLLQEGRYVADLIYIYGEDTPMRLNTREPKVPFGYAWDACPADLAIESMRVEDGEIVLPSGMRYRVLLLPPDRRLTVELLRKVEALLKDGATVLGIKPEGSPSLSGYPQTDAEVRALADRLWPESSEPGAERRHGQGRMINAWDMDSVAEFRRNIVKHHRVAEMEAHLDTILPALGLEPDFRWQAVGPAPRDAEVNWIHRRMDDGSEVYFLANGRYAPLAIEADFRIAGRVPQLWRPDSGKRETAVDWREENGRTKLRLDFDPAASLFVVFRPEGVGELPPLARRLEFREALSLDGPWEVRFQANRGAPEKTVFDKLISWPEHDEFGIKYFSGTATYHGKFTVPAEVAAAEVVLDLGQVKNLAGVRVNGKSFGTLWKEPFTVNLTGALRPGENEFEIEVTNLWTNRMIGDEQLPDDAEYEPGGRFGRTATLKQWPAWLLEGRPRPSERIFFSSYKFATASDPLVPSGLLGPVTLRPASVSTTIR